MGLTTGISRTEDRVSRAEDGVAEHGTGVSRAEDGISRAEDGVIAGRALSSAAPPQLHIAEVGFFYRHSLNLNSV